MNSLKKSLAAVCASLFILTAVIALILFNMDLKAFKAETYQQIFAKEDFYNRIPIVLAEATLDAVSSQSGLSLFLQGLTLQDWEAFMRAILPAESLKAIGNETLNSAFAYLNGQSDVAQISLAPLKANMSGDAGIQATYTLLARQPNCTLEQIADITLALLQQSQIQFCNPPAELQPFFTPVIQAQLQATAALLPDQITLIDANDPAQQSDPREQLNTIRLVMRLSPILPLLFLFLTSILAVNSLKSWLKWWGIPFTITGAIASLMGISSAPVTNLILQRVLINNMPAILPAILLDYAGELAAAMIQQMLEPVLWQGLIIMLIGLVMTGGAFLSKQR